MKYAIIRLKGSQYKVSEGQEILVDKISGEEINPDVLLFVDGDAVSLGTPFVKGASVSVKVVEPEVKGEKIDVMKYKAKSRYRRKIGFRPQYSKLLIEKVSLK